MSTLSPVTGGNCSFLKIVCRIGAVVLMISPQTGLLAQQEDSAQPSGPEKLPEEIIVTNPVSLIRLRIEVKKAEENMYDVFNDLNDDDRFDIHCRMETRIDSHMKEHRCVPNYYQDAMEAEAHLFLKEAGALGNQAVGPGSETIHHYNNMLADKMKEVVRESPEFRQAISKYQELTEDYEEQRKERFGKE